MTMTKRRVKQYLSLLREINMLENRIHSVTCGGEFVTDMVRGSMTHPPYTQHNIVIHGFGSDTVPKLSARKAWCIAECKTIEDFITSLDDSVMRQLLTRRYLEGRSIKETASLVGYSERQVGRIINDFFGKDVL